MTSKVAMSLLLLLPSCCSAITLGFSGTEEADVRPAIMRKAKPDRLIRKDTTKLQATLTRMQYWTTAGEPKAVNDKYLIFSPDEGGPNNIRIGWEMSGLVARKTGRTLVLPPPKNMYLLDSGPSKRMPKEISEGHTTTAVEDLINLAQLKANLPTLTAKEFESRTGKQWKDAKNEAMQVPEDQMCKLSAYGKVDNPYLYMAGERREGFSCAAWWLMGGPKDELKTVADHDDWSLLTHGFVWHPDAFNIASNVVNQMGIFDYNALHARYNDFQFHDEQKEPSDILNGSMSLLQLSPKLYVASDDPDRIRKLGGLNGTEVSTFDDMMDHGALKDVKNQYTPERWFKMLGPVEELICTYSKIFVGTGHSTFSGHINRMRVHAQAPTTRTYTYGEHYHDVYGANDNALENAKQDISAWEKTSKKDNVIRRTPLEGDAFLEMSDN